METKNIIKILKKFNNWRRGWEWEQPNPKQITNAINEAIEKLKELNSYNELFESMKQTKNTLIKKLEFQENLNITWVWELQFERLQKEHYKSIIDEVEVLLDKWVKPQLIKQVIKNWKERAIIDLSIHTDLLFN